MKKRTMTFLAAVLTITAAVFTSCVTQHPNLDYVNVETLWLVGSITSWDAPDKTFANVIALKKKDALNFELEYAAKKDDTIEFKLLVNEKKWGHDYTYGGDLELNKKVDFTSIPGAGNTKLKVEKGKKYLLKVFVVDASTLNVTVTEKN